MKIDKHIKIQLNYKLKLLKKLKSRQIKENNKKYKIKNQNNQQKTKNKITSIVPLKNKKLNKYIINLMSIKKNTTSSQLLWLLTNKFYIRYNYWFILVLYQKFYLED